MPEHLDVCLSFLWGEEESAGMASHEVFLSGPAMSLFVTTTGLVVISVLEKRG